MASTLGNLLRKVADDCDKGCGVSSEEFEKVAQLQLRDHEDIKTMMTSILLLKQKVDDLSGEKEKVNCKIVKMHEQDPV